MIQAAAMFSHGVFDKFPKLRVAFLEGGVTWVPFLMDRIDRSFNEGHYQVDLDGKLLAGPQPGEKPSAYLRKDMNEGRVFVGFDCDDRGLRFAVEVAGKKPFLFASDFPHECISAKACRREIDELLSREDLTMEDKEAVLGANAQRFIVLRLSDQRTFAGAVLSNGFSILVDLFSALNRYRLRPVD
jgi:predicted TIM-barrel fold metal-dependent hydrolase